MIRRFVSNLRDARVKKGLSQEKLARLAEVSRVTVRNIEQGTSVPSVFLALKISRFVDCPIEKLFKLEDSHETRMEGI